MRSAAHPAALGAWLAYLALDFLTHAVLLAPWWRATAAHWHAPAELFRRIPYAYLAFALYCGGLVWLLTRILGPRPALAPGLRLGGAAGLLFGLITALGNHSVLAVPVSALLVWPAAGAFASVGAAGAAIRVLRSARPGRSLRGILLAALAVFALGVVIQNLLFPTPSDALAG